MSNQRLAASWHWIGLFLAVLLMVAWRFGLDLRPFVLALVAWEALGTWGHYWLRIRRA